MELPVDRVFEAPAEIEEIPEEERRRRAWVEPPFAMFEDRRFLRGAMPLVFREAGAEFTYVCWVEVSREQGDLARHLWADERSRRKVDCIGALANAPPPFESDRGCSVRLRVPIGADLPVVTAIEGELARAQAAPGFDRREHRGVVAEALFDAFSGQVEARLEESLGPVRAWEEFGGSDWRRGPRKIVIAEIPPADAEGAGAVWRYVTIGLSARPMPGAEARAEILWETGRRVTDGGLFRAMASMAAMPWHLRNGFFEGHVQTFPQGFPPQSQFRSVVFYDAARRLPGLEGLAVFGQPVRVLGAVPLLDAEREKVTPENFGDWLKRLASTSVVRIQ